MSATRGQGPKTHDHFEGGHSARYDIIIKAGLLTGKWVYFDNLKHEMRKHPNIFLWLCIFCSFSRLCGFSCRSIGSSFCILCCFCCFSCFCIFSSFGRGCLSFVSGSLSCRFGSVRLTKESFSFVVRQILMGRHKCKAISVNEKNAAKIWRKMWC